MNLRRVAAWIAVLGGVGLIVGVGLVTGWAGSLITASLLLIAAGISNL